MLEKVKHWLCVLCREYKKGLAAPKQVYFLRLERIYYDAKKKKVLTQFLARGKRKPWLVAADEVLHDNSIISELHPIDAFLIGIISRASRENKKYLDFDFLELSRLKKYVDYYSPSKTNTLQITEKYTRPITNELYYNLKYKKSKKTLLISHNDFISKPSLLTLLAPLEALAVAFDVEM